MISALFLKPPPSAALRFNLSGCRPQPAVWAADIRRARHIGDFTNWKDPDAYAKALKRLMRDLKGEPAPPGSAPEQQH